MYEVFGSVLICCMAFSFVKSLEQKPFKESSYTVAIINKNEARFKCVGTLIHPTHVVTASHCVEDNSSKYVVVHSTSSFSLTKIDNAVPVIAIRFRRKVNGIRCEDNDIAVLRLGSVVNHEPIMLSEDDVGLKDGFLSKWNRKNNGDETICNLESIPIGIYDPKTCRQANEKKQHIYNNICGAPSTNATLVKGDSGSPLLTQNGTRLVLLGILYCKLNGVMNATYPAAFVRISMHDKWIQDVIKSSIEETTINTDVTTDSDIKETTFNAAPENNSPNTKFIILSVTFIVLVLGALCTYTVIKRWKLEQNTNVNAELISLNNVLPAAVEPLSSPATVDKGG